MPNLNNYEEFDGILRAFDNLKNMNFEDLATFYFYHVNKANEFLHDSLACNSAMWALVCANEIEYSILLGK